jgi:hypothetical protein
MGARQDYRWCAFFFSQQSQASAENGTDSSLRYTGWAMLSIRFVSAWRNPSRIIGILAERINDEARSTIAARQ